MNIIVRMKDVPVLRTFCFGPHRALACLYYSFIIMCICLLGLLFVMPRTWAKPEPETKTTSDVPPKQAVSSEADKEKTESKNRFWKVIRVGFYPFIGYHDIDEQGNRSGFGYDYLHNLRRYTPWGFDYSDPVYKWGDMIPLLEAGKIDLITNVQKTPEREKRIAFSKNPMGIISMILTVKEGCTRYRLGDYKNWSGMRIGLIRGSELNPSLEKFAKEKGFTFHAVYYDDSAIMLNDLQHNALIDAVFTSDLRRLHNEWVYDEIGVMPCYIAVNRNNTELLAELDHAMLQLQTQSPDLNRALRSKYFSEIRGDQIAYTAKEHKFITQCKAQGRSFVAILNPDRRPLSYCQDGQYYGIMKDIADEIIKRTNLNIVFLPTKSSADYRSACSSPEVDIIFDSGINFEEAEKQHLVLSEAFYSSPISLLRRRNRTGLLKTYALVEPSYVAELMRNQVPADKTTVCQSFHEAVKLVTDGTCDAAFMCARQAEYLIYDDPHGQLISDYLPGKVLQHSVGVRDTVNPLLASIVNKAVISIGDDFINRITMEHIANMEPSYTLGRLFALYPGIFVTIPMVILLLVCAFFFYYLHSRKKAYRTGLIFNALPIRYFVIDAQGTVLFHNVEKNLALLTGQLRTLDDVGHDEVRQQMKEKTGKVIRTGNPDVATYTFEPTEIRSAMITRLPDGSFDRPAAIWISQDVTELEKTRNEAKQNEEFCRLTLESISDGVIATDVQGRIIMLNPITEQLIGVKAKDVIGRPHEEIFNIVGTYDDIPRESPVTRCLRTGEVVELDNHTDLISFDGTRRYHVADSAAPIYDAHGNIIGAILVFRDVTAEYKRRSEMKNELVAWEVISAMAQIYRFRVNAATRRIDGSILTSDVWPVQNGQAGFSEGWIHPEDLAHWKKQFNSICNGNRPETRFRYRVLQNEKVRYFQCFMRGDPEHPNEVTGLIQEISDFVQEQNKQNAINDLLSACINTVPAIIFLKSTNDDFRYEMCNNKFCEFFDRPLEKIVGYTDLDLFGDPNEVMRFRQSDMQVIESGKPQEFHEEVRDAKGELHQLRVTKLPVKDANGNPLLFGISLDITEDYKLRLELQTLLKNWEIAADIAQLATYRIKYKTWEITGNKLLPEFWPIRDGKAVEAREWVYPDDVHLCEENYEAVITDRLPQAAFVYRVWRDNGMRYYRIFVHKTREFPDEITGLIQDITPFILAQQQKENVLAMWKSIVDSVPAIFYIKDARNDFRYVQCNRYISELFGLSPEDVIGRTDEELFIRTKDAQTIRENDVKAMELGKPQKYLELLLDSKGVIRRFDSTKIPIQDSTGQPVLIGMAMEVTELAELSEIRKIISSTFELLFPIDNLEEGIQMVLKNVCDFLSYSRAYVSHIDHETKTLRLFATYVPNGAQLVFGNQSFCIDEVRHMSWFNCLMNAKRGDTFDCDFSKEEDRKLAELHTPAILSKYEEFGISGVHVNYISVGDKPWGSIGFITENGPTKKLTANERRMLEMLTHIIELSIFRKQMFEKLEEAAKAAQAADKAKSFFLASMSHEIRTPLNAVIGFADILKDVHLEPGMQQEYLSNISMAGSSLLQLVNDILDLSKLEANQVEFVPEKTNMIEFTRSISALFNLSADQKNLRLVFDMGNLPDLYIDQQRMRQILFNLIGNAIKFTHTGGIRVSTNFELNKEDEGTLLISVADTGMGIATEDQERLFEPFVQLPRMRGTNSTNNGTGLGLPIVKKMVTQMGGVISLKSTLGQGSTFSIMIPNVKVGLPGSPEVFKAKQQLVPHVTSSPVRILLVDDVPINLKVFTSMLKRLHVSCKTASSGKEALDMLKQETFDIVLTDLIMPEMSGMELAKNIRSMPEYDHIRLAAVTGDRDKASGFLDLFDQIMEKPISRDELYEYIFGKGRQ